MSHPLLCNLIQKNLDSCAVLKKHHVEFFGYACSIRLEHWFVGPSIYPPVRDKEHLAKKCVVKNKSTCCCFFVFFFYPTSIKCLVSLWCFIQNISISSTYQLRTFLFGRNSPNDRKNSNKINKKPITATVLTIQTT